MGLVVGSNCGFVTIQPGGDPNAAVLVTMDDHVRAQLDVSPSTSDLEIQEIGWWCDDATEEANFEVGLYDQDSSPYDLLFSDKTNAKGTDAGWKRVSGLGWSISASTSYNIAVQLDNTVISTRLQREEAGGKYRYNSSTSTLPDPTWTSTTTTAGLLAIYALVGSAVGSSYTRELTESLASADSRAFEPQQYLTFSPTISDSLVKDGSITKTESMTLAETVANAEIMGRTLSEALSFSDSLTKDIQQNITESINITETIIKDISTTRAETITLTDSARKEAQKMLSEAMSQTDSMTRVATFVRQLSETLNIDETVVRSFLKIKALVESLAFVESVEGETFPGITLTEQMQLKDNFKRTRTFANRLVGSVRKIFGDDVADTFDIPKKVFGDDIKKDDDL